MTKIGYHLLQESSRFEVTRVTKAGEDVPIYRVSSCLVKEYEGRECKIHLEEEEYILIMINTCEDWSKLNFITPWINPFKNRNINATTHKQEFCSVYGSIYKNSAISMLAEGLKKIALDFIDEKQKLITISGSSGCGKTYLCSAIEKSLFARNLCYIALNSSIFMEKIHNELKFNKDYYEYLSSCKNRPFLLMDDVGSTMITDWRREVFFDLLDNRVSNDMSTLLTTNLRKDEFKKEFGIRISSRCLSGEFFELQGDDRRLKFQALSKK